MESRHVEATSKKGYMTSFDHRIYNFFTQQTMRAILSHQLQVTMGLKVTKAHR